MDFRRLWWIFGGNCSVDFPKKKGFNHCHRKLHHILHCEKEICHPELTLGASLPYKTEHQVLQAPCFKNSKSCRSVRGQHDWGARSWNVISREPSGDRIARSCRHTVPDLTIQTELKDTIAKSLLSQYVLGFWGPFKQWLNAMKSSKASTGSQNTFWDSVAPCRKGPVACRKTGAN